MHDLLESVIRERGLSDADLAGLAGVPTSTISSLRWRREWSLPTALRIAEALDVEIEPTIPEALTAEQMLDHEELSDGEVAYLSGIQQQIGERLDL